MLLPVRRVGDFSAVARLRAAAENCIFAWSYLLLRCLRGVIKPQAGWPDDIPQKRPTDKFNFQVR